MAKNAASDSAPLLPPTGNPVRPPHPMPFELRENVHECFHPFKNESFELSDGRKMRGDAGECLLLIRRYFYRTLDDLNGLTFRQEQAKKNELLVVNSSELRAVQGHHKRMILCLEYDQPTKA